MRREEVGKKSKLGEDENGLSCWSRGEISESKTAVLHCTCQAVEGLA